MRKVASCAGLLIFSCAGVLSQGASVPNFEAATVRPAAPHSDGTPLTWQGCKGGPETADPGRLTCTGPLGMLICVAYGVQYYQVAGPDWLMTDFYDIAAKVPIGATRDEYRLMWQNLLAERFQLTLHREGRERTVRSLVLAKGGSKLRRSATDVTPANGGDSKPGYAQSMNGWVMRFTGKRQPLSVLAGFLSTGLAANGPVSNDTGLAGDYDFTLEFTPDDLLVQAGDKAGPTLAAALETQLGLRLEAKKAPIDVLVVDRAEKKPTDN